jgi:diamine N-acetyltransferase
MHVTPSPALRAAGPADAVLLGVLGAQVFLDTYATEGIRLALAREVRQSFDSEVMAALLARPEGGFIVAERAGHLLGFVQFMVGARHAAVEAVDARPAAEIERLYVLRRFQGQGVGLALMAAAAAHARDAGCATLWLTAWVGNLHALAWYARQGWRDIGATPYTFEGETFENRVLVKGA